MKARLKETGKIINIMPVTYYYVLDSNGKIYAECDENEFEYIGNTPTRYVTENNIETFKDYQKNAKTFLLEKLLSMPKTDLAKYCALGINEEAGEVAGKVKKSIRDDEQELQPERIEAIALELGDTLWYITIMADAIGIPLHRIAEMNIEKLTDRKERNVIKGDGDNR